MAHYFAMISAAPTTLSVLRGLNVPDSVTDTCGRFDSLTECVQMCIWFKYLCYVVQFMRFLVYVFLRK